MTPIQTLFAHTRAAHRTALNSAETMMTAVADHDDEYVGSTVSELEGAAAKMELSARTLRAQIAVFRHATEKS
ncbi:hypothetical protein [Leisingera caerulea]|uniref:hypothetical protein n=1 Tax=Leisingera caerulea TaxID=506591 RepID=UPI00047F1583|nr:hypothetical protein [Leisingera caerulea]